jgi:hypothetical protein
LALSAFFADEYVNVCADRTPDTLKKHNSNKKNTDKSFTAITTFNSKKNHPQKRYLTIFKKCIHIQKNTKTAFLITIVKKHLIIDTYKYLTSNIKDAGE